MGQKRKAEMEKVEAASAAKKAKTEGSGVALIDTLKERLKNKIEASNKAKAANAEKTKPKVEGDDAPAAAEEASGKAKEGKKVKGGAKDGADTKGRREELLKQLRAVEDAIHRKRTKLDG